MTGSVKIIAPAAATVIPFLSEREFIILIPALFFREYRQNAPRREAVKKIKRGCPGPKKRKK